MYNVTHRIWIHFSRVEGVPMFDDEIESATKVGNIKSLAKSANETSYNNLLLSSPDKTTVGAVDEA